MSRRHTIFYSALMLTGVNLLLRLAGTAFQVYLSGHIGAAGIGLLQLTMSVGSLAMVAGMGGIRTATMYLTAHQIGRGRHENVTWVLSGCFLYSILFSGTVALALYNFAPWLAEHWIGDMQTIPALRLLGAFLPVVCLCGVMTGYFTAANRIGTLAAVEVAEQAASMGVTMGLLAFWAGRDAGRACLSVVLGSALGSVLTLACLIFLRLIQQPVCGERISVGRSILDAALPLALADDLRTGINTAENLMVPQRLALCAGVQEPLAAFGMVSGMVFPVMMFPAAILFGLNELLIPELARCRAARSTRRIRYLVRRSLRVALVYGLVFSGLLFLLSDALCLRLYGSTDAARDLRLYGILVPMLYCDAVTDAMTKGLGQQKACVRYNIITSAMDVAFLYILLPKYGMTGYFSSFFITHLVNFLLSLRRLMKITGQRIPFHLPALGTAGCIFAVFAADSLDHSILRAGAYLAILTCALFLSGLLRKEDIKWLRDLVRK